MTFKYICWILNTFFHITNENRYFELIAVSWIGIILLFSDKKKPAIKITGFFLKSFSGNQEI